MSPVQIIARTICETRGHDPDGKRFFHRGGYNVRMKEWHVHKHTARKIITAMRDDLKKDATKWQIILSA